MSVAEPLAAWAAALRWDDIPAKVQAQARAIWLEIFGCMLLGASHPETRMLGHMLQAKDAGGSSTAVGLDVPLAPLDAILLNGLASGVDLFDGGNVASRGHVAGYVFAATLTAAEACDATFAQTLAAFVAGYEVAARIGAATQLHVELHPSGTWNTIGAAAAVGHLRGMDAAAMRRTIELAANMTLATSWDAAIHGASVRDLYHPLPNYLGSMAADLSVAGFTGGPRSIEVTFGEISGDRFEAETCLGGLGESWLLDANYMKRYPNCRNFQACLDAIFQLLPHLQRPFDPKRDRVRIGADPFACRDNRGVHADTTLAARESMPVSLAMALIYQAVTPLMYRDGAHQNAAVLELANRIEVAEEVPRPFPYARPGWVEIEQDGAVSRCDLAEPAGNPGTPFTPDEVREKFIECAQTLLGRAAAATASDQMLTGDPAVPFREALRRWTGAGVAVEH